MSKTTIFEVAGDHAAAFQYALDDLQHQGFIITSRPQYFEAQVERGSKQATIWLGAIVGKKQHLRMDVRAYANGPNLVISVTPSTTGVAAGVIGVGRARRFYGEVTAHLGNALYATGKLVGSNLAG